MGRLLRLDALAMLLYRCTADRRVHPLFALFRKFKVSAYGGFGHLAVRDRRLWCTATHDRLPSANYRVAAAASRANSQSTLVPWTTPAICNLGQLPRFFFLRLLAVRSIFILFLFQFSNRIASVTAVGNSFSP